MPLRHVLLALLVAAVYGVAFVAIKAGVGEIPPLLLTGYRFLFAAVPLILVVKRPDVGLGWLAAFGVMQGVIMFGLIFTAIGWGMPAGLASLVVQTQVFFTILLSAYLFRERWAPAQIAGALVALGGIAVIGLARTEAAPAVPFLLVIASAAAWAAANVIAKAARPQNMLSFVVWSSAFAPLPLFVLSAVFEGTRFGLPPALPGTIAIASIMFLAWPTTVFAFSAWVFLLRRYNAATVTPFALLIPVFGITSTVLAFGERFDRSTAFGSLLVFAGLAINVFAGKLFAKSVL